MLCVLLSSFIIVVDKLSFSNVQQFFEEQENIQVKM